MRLALALGWVDVDAMLQSIPSRQLGEWMAYYELEPFGQDRADIPAAVVAAQVANTIPRKGGRAVSPNDYLPMIGGRGRRGQTAEQQKAVAKALGEALRRRRQRG